MSALSASGYSKLNRRDCYVLAGFLLFLLIFFSGVLAQSGERCLGRAGLDAQQLFYGSRAYGFGEVRAGRFPLWNPYEFLGMPFVATLQSAMFYPMNWLCAVLPICLAINLVIILDLFLSGLFSYLWARRFGLSWLGAIVAAAAYVFGAPQILHIFAGHWDFLAMMPWIPCILLCVEMLVGGGFQPPAIVLGAVAVAMEWFGGNPQYAFYGGIAAVLYLAGRLWQRRELGARGAARVVGSFVLIYVLGSALAGVQLMPALELFRISARRGQLSYDWVRQFSFVPEGLLRFLVPDIFGADVAERYWGRWNLWETSPYVGVVAVGLAFIALLRGRRGRALLPGCIALICLLMAMGGNAVFFWLIPGFDLFRAQARWLCPVSLFIGLLAGLGADGPFDHAQGRPEGTRTGDIAAPAGKDESIARADGRGMWILAGLAALLLLAGGTLCSDVEFGLAAWWRFMDAMLKIAPGERTYLHGWTPSAAFKLAAMHTAELSMLRAGLFLGALAGLVRIARSSRLKPGWIAAALLLLTAIDAWTFGHRYLDTFDPREAGLSPDAVEFLAQRAEPFRFWRGGCFALPPCEGMTHRLPCIEGVQPNAPARFLDVFWSLQSEELYEQMKHGLLRPYAIFSFQTPLRMLNLRYVVTYASFPKPPIGGLSTVYEDPQIRIDELPDSWPRAWLVHQYAVKRESMNVLLLLSRFDYKKMALFEKDPGCAVEEPPAVEPIPEIRRYEPARVEIEVQAAAPALLVLSDLFYPGWEATLDGRPAEILRANYLMRAVAIPEGAHEVRFLYRPASFRAGVAVSAAGCLGIASLIFSHWRTRRRRKE